MKLTEEINNYLNERRTLWGSDENKDPMFIKRTQLRDEYYEGRHHYPKGFKSLDDAIMKHSGYKKHELSDLSHDSTGIFNAMLNIPDKHIHTLHKEYVDLE